MDKTPIILTGPPGCGKSYWIQKYAEQLKKQLFVCPCRKDRTLRDGRQKLHIWARRTEPAILWLEGADDLTPEAQAFLRRILETHAQDVLFILECRDAGRLQEPIRSRCIIKKLYQPTWQQLEEFITKTYSSVNKTEIKEYLKKNEYSYRRVKQCCILQIQYPDMWKQTLEHRKKEIEISKNMSADNLISYIKGGYNPEILINTLLSNEELLKDYGKCVELSGSLWAFLGSALYKASTTTKIEEE
jgi:replication-associated recombination protein RarA